MTDKKYVGSIEAGGTKFIVAVQELATKKVIAKDRISTADPQKPCKTVLTFLKNILLML